MIRSTLSHPARAAKARSTTPVRIIGVALFAAVAGCSTIDRAVTGDKVDYKSSVPAKRTTLEVPPDLTQLSGDARFQVPTSGSGTVSASSYRPAASIAPVPGSLAAASGSSANSTAAPVVGAPAAATVASGAAPVASIAPSVVGDVKLERSTNQRWLSTTQTPEQIWPQLQAFWQERGFTLSLDQPDIGVMETDWAENRAKLPQDIIRNTLGRVLDSLYSTGERDKFRTRVERTPTGSEIYVTHRGMEEVYSNNQTKDQTVWQPRPEDTQLEAEFLSRLMAKMGSPAAIAAANGVTTAANAAALPLGPPRARVLTGLPSAALQVDDKFDRAWRGVGLALDRSGFTVEDRDRAQGIYFVRYVDPATAGKEAPGFMRRMFTFGSKSKDNFSPQRFRVMVKEDAGSSTVTVQNDQGAPEKGEAGQRIVALLVDDLK